MPVPISDRMPGSGGGKLRIVPLQPFGHIEKVDLLRPEQTRKRLPLNKPSRPWSPWVDKSPRRTHPLRRAVPERYDRNRPTASLRVPETSLSRSTTDAPGWNFVAIIEAGFRPYTGRVDGRKLRCSRWRGENRPSEKDVHSGRRTSCSLVRFVVRKQRPSRPIDRTDNACLIDM